MGCASQIAGIFIDNVRNRIHCSRHQEYDLSIHAILKPVFLRETKMQKQSASINFSTHMAQKSILQSPPQDTFLLRNGSFHLQKQIHNPRQLYLHHF